MYVEVKGTQMSSLSSFPISHSEVNFAREKGRHYVIYHVSGVSLQATHQLVITKIPDPIAQLNRRAFTLFMESNLPSALQPIDSEAKESADTHRENIS